MQCSLCKNEQYKIRIHGNDLDVCPKCTASWLDSNELDRVLLNRKRAINDKNKSNTTNQLKDSVSLHSYL
jgi:Zn-finger nucleic acid-binding protein